MLSPLGVELLGVFFLSARPTPEVAKALEAEYREALLRQADEAIYARRGAAVDEERKIKTKELESDKALEQQREALIALQGANALKEAENRGMALEKEAQYRARGTELELAVLSDLDPRLLFGRRHVRNGYRTPARWAISPSPAKCWPACSIRKMGMRVRAINSEVLNGILE